MSKNPRSDAGGNDKREPRYTNREPEVSKALLEPGTLLSHTYQIGDLLGRGGLGEVYLARHVEIGTKHAIKIIRPELLSNPTVLDLFRREAAFLREIRHDAVVSYDGAFRDESGRLFLVMEYIDGDSLSDVMKTRPLKGHEVITLRNRLAEGLAAAHAKNIVHRDVSPDNVIFPQGLIDQAKLIDFGIAKSDDPDVATIIGDSFAGKYRFASPEQLGLFGGKVGPRSDIYSLGLVLAAAAMGRPLEMGGTHAAVTQSRQSVPDLRLVPEEFRVELSAMLQPDPADRPQSVLNLIDYGGTTAIERSGRTAGAVETRRSKAPDARGRSQRPAKRRSGAFFAAAAIVVLALGGAGLYFYPFNGGGEKNGGGEQCPEITTLQGLKQIARCEAGEIYTVASGFIARGDPDTALVLFEQAAGKGHGPAALAIGEMYDPVLWGEAPSPFSKPNPRKAREWYENAVSLGNDAGRQRLEKLATYQSEQ